MSKSDTTLYLQYKPIFIFAGRTTENGQYDFRSQVNLSGQTEWKVPSGRWTIISFEMTKDPNEQIDYLDSAAVARTALASGIVLAPGNAFSAAQAAGAFMRFNVAQCGDPRVISVLQRAIKGSDAGAS